MAIFLLAGCLACAGPKITREPAPGLFYQSLSMKYIFHGGLGRQNGRFHCRFDAGNAKFLFFNPLNQLALELDVAGETALLLRPGKKLYWQGDFSFLLESMWGIQLNFEELKQLILAGAIPEEKTIGKDITIDLETEPGNRSPRIIHIRQNDADLTLKIVSSETRPGRVVLLDRDRRFRAAGLEDVLSDD